jgi:hypothetical protein
MSLLLHSVFRRPIIAAPISLRNSGSLAFLVTAIATAVTVATYGRATQLEEEIVAKEKKDKQEYQLAVNFMDKLADKVYLQTEKNERPERIPTTLRLLTIDVPLHSSSNNNNNNKNLFKDGVCRVATDHVYPDGVVPDKQVRVPIVSEETKGFRITGKNNAQHLDLEIEQKVLVQSMFQCYHDGKVGIQVQEASIRNLNPRNLKRNHPMVRSLRNSLTSSSGHNLTAGTNRTHRLGKHEREEEDDHEATTVYDELEAPWHQHAWISELQLRISGQVRWGEPLQAKGSRSKGSSSGWFTSNNNNTYQITQYYKPTIAQRSSGWWWPFRSRAVEHHDGWKDTENNPEANKPHAVIASGAALAHVPAAARLLHRFCQEFRVPLYVLDDPRRTASQRHPVDEGADDIRLVLQDIHKRVKRTIVQNQLESSAGSSFQRGRWLGATETEAQWRLREGARLTKAAIVRAQQQQQLKSVNWRNLSARELRSELLQHGVLIETGVGGADEDDGIGCTDAFRAIAKECLQIDVYEDDRETPADSDSF